ncbi:hypothetical protein GCM10009849_15770 [Sinomonas flava]|uniref:Uncharacterized protein n=1 Tax=Sinomonas flava TaxID=496857 RepID=A0ABN3BSE7_9MICC
MTIKGGSTVDQSSAVRPNDLGMTPKSSPQVCPAISAGIESARPVHRSLRAAAAVHASTKRRSGAGSSLR